MLVNACKQKKLGFVKKILRAECSFCLTKLTLALFSVSCSLFLLHLFVFSIIECVLMQLNIKIHIKCNFMCYFSFFNPKTHISIENTHISLSKRIKCNFMCHWSDFVCLSIDFDLRLNFWVKMTPESVFGVKMTPESVLGVKMTPDRVLGSK